MDRLFDTYWALRKRLARLLMGIVPPGEVEDIVQETYVRVCRMDSKEAIREPRSFLFRTAQNLALDYVKRAETRLTSSTDSIEDYGETDLTAPSDSTYGQVASDEEFALFCEAVRELPKQCRRAFILKKVYGYTLKEIAAEMRISESTVECHIVVGTKRCVTRLRELESSHSAGSRSAFQPLPGGARAGRGTGR